MSMMDVELSGKVAYITGGASGIGRGIARALAYCGADVVIADINVAAAERVASEIISTGGRGLAQMVDVTNYSSVEAGVEQAIDQYGSLDFVFANAAILGPVDHFTDTSIEWQHVLDVNLIGVMNTCKAVMPHMMQKGQGRSIITVSPNGLRAGTHVIPYRVSKAAAVMYTRCLALLLAPYHITVNAISPGVTMTPMEQEYISTICSQKGISTAEYRIQRAARIPLGRFVEIDEIAALAVFLVSEPASIITGQVIGIDGGMEIV